METRKMINVQNNNGCLHDPNTGRLNGDRRAYKWKCLRNLWEKLEWERKKRANVKETKQNKIQTNKRKENSAIERREKSRIRRHRDYGKNGTFIILLVIIILLPIIIHFFSFSNEKTHSSSFILTLSLVYFFPFCFWFSVTRFFPSRNQALPLALLRYMHDNSARASSMLIESRSFSRRRSRYMFENHICLSSSGVVAGATVTRPRRPRFSSFNYNIIQ